MTSRLPWRAWMLCLAGSGADLAAFVPGENMVYFTGLHFLLSERPILGLYSRQGLSFIMPELEVAKLEARPDLEARRFIWTDQSGYELAFREAIAALAPGDTTCAMDGQTPAILRMARAGEGRSLIGEHG